MLEFNPITNRGMGVNRRQKCLQPNPNPINEDTVKTGPQIGRLFKLSKSVCEIVAKKRMFENCLQEGISTYKIEVQALKLNAEKKGESFKKNRKSKWGLIREERDVTVVKDLLELKVKYCKEREEMLKKDYMEIKEQIKNWYRKRKKIKKFRKLIQRVTTINSSRWKKAQISIDMKIA